MERSTPERPEADRTHHEQFDKDQVRRRVSFDEAASTYDRVRPDDPEQLFDDLLTLAGVPAGASVLEIGSGTGKATVPLARRGFRVLGIEQSEQMAALARPKLAAYPRVQIAVGAFEEWPLPEAAFDLAVSASAWQWIDPSIGYTKVAQALRPHGMLALMWSSTLRADSRAHHHDTGDAGHSVHEYEAFTQALQGVVGQLVPELAHRRADSPRAGTPRFVQADDLEASGYFTGPVVRTYTWELPYETARYLVLLDSYSAYRALDPGLHAQLFRAIGDLIEGRFGGMIRRPLRAELYLAKRR